MEKKLEVVPDGNEKGEFFLTPEERLSIQLIKSEGRSLEFEAAARRMALERQMREVAESIKTRIGVDITDGKHEVDLGRGLIIEKPAK